MMGMSRVHSAQENAGHYELLHPVLLSKGLGWSGLKTYSVKIQERLQRSPMQLDFQVQLISLDVLRNSLAITPKEFKSQARLLILCHLKPLRNLYALTGTLLIKAQRHCTTSRI